MIDEWTVRRVKEAASVVDVLGDFMELQRNGKDYTCLCPFHQDRHLGSFSISPTRNTYKCFSCGAQGGPVDFLVNHEHMDFPDAIRWLGRKYGIPVEGSEKFAPTLSKPRKAQPLPSTLPTLVLSKSLLMARRDTTHDTLCCWIRQLPWDSQQAVRVEKVLNAYIIGHSKHGHTIFWQVDEQGNVRTGKMMLYRADGHRDKESRWNFDFIHSVLLRNGWWSQEEYTMRQTLFGMHLLDMAPDAVVNIVESEKTAVICSIVYGSMRRHIWMATGGMQNLNRRVLQPIIERGRRIALYPDHDGIDKWNEAAKAIEYSNLTVESGFVTRYWKEGVDKDKADIADIFIRQMEDTQRRNGSLLVKEYLRRHPLLKPLFTLLDLVPDKQ